MSVGGGVGGGGEEQIKPRSLRFTWSMKTTSSRDPNDIMAEIRKVPPPPPHDIQHDNGQDDYTQHDDTQHTQHATAHNTTGLLQHATLQPHATQHATLQVNTVTLPNKQHVTAQHRASYDPQQIQHILLQQQLRSPVSPQPPSSPTGSSGQQEQQLLLLRQQLQQGVLPKQPSYQLRHSQSSCGPTRPGTFTVADLRRLQQQQLQQQQYLQQQPKLQKPAHLELTLQLSPTKETLSQVSLGVSAQTGHGTRASIEQLRLLFQQNIQLQQPQQLRPPPRKHHDSSSRHHHRSSSHHASAPHSPSLHASPPHSPSSHSLLLAPRSPAARSPVGSGSSQVLVASLLPRSQSPNSHCLEAPFSSQPASLPPPTRHSPACTPTHLSHISHHHLQASLSMMNPRITPATSGSSPTSPARVVTAHFQPGGASLDLDYDYRRDDRSHRYYDDEDFSADDDDSDELVTSPRRQPQSSLMTSLPHKSPSSHTLTASSNLHHSPSSPRSTTPVQLA